MDRKIIDLMGEDQDLDLSLSEEEIKKLTEELGFKHIYQMSKHKKNAHGGTGNSYLLIPTARSDSDQTNSFEASSINRGYFPRHKDKTLQSDKDAAFNKKPCTSGKKRVVFSDHFHEKRWQPISEKCEIRQNDSYSGGTKSHFE